MKTLVKLIKYKFNMLKKVLNFTNCSNLELINSYIENSNSGIKINFE